MGWLAAYAQMCGQASEYVAEVSPRLTPVEVRIVLKSGSVAHVVLQKAGPGANQLKEVASLHAHLKVAPDQGRSVHVRKILSRHVSAVLLAFKLHAVARGGRPHILSLTPRWSRNRRSHA